MSAAMQPDDPGAEQSFISHLVELRDRIIRMLIALGLVAVVLLPFANALYAYVAAPLIAQLPEGNTMIATQVASPLLTPFKLALVAAAFLSMPYLLYQLWAFVAPGLYQHEKRLALPLLVASILLFYLGVAFAYYLVFPLIFAFFAGTTPEGVAMMTDISSYLDFVLTLFFAFGVAFQIPVATILLVAIGVVTPESLEDKRPYVVVGAFVVGMLLTPPDVISQTLLAVPMWMLFEMGVLFSKLLLRRRAAAAAAGATDEGVRAADTAEVSAQGSGQQDRWRPLTADEMEAELDLIDHEEARASQAPSTPPELDAVEDKIRRANRLRDLDNDFAARQLLYQVLEEGSEDQRRVARDILGQMDGD